MCQVVYSASVSGEDTRRQYFWIEFFWHDPYTGKQDVDLPNNGGGGFWGFTKALDVVKSHCPWAKDELGRDSIYLYNREGNDSTLSIRINKDVNEFTAQQNDTVWYMKRLPVTESQDKCEIIVAVNFASIRTPPNWPYPLIV